LIVPAATATEFAASALELLPPEPAPLAPAPVAPPPWWPDLARWLSDRLTQTLFAQRRQLLASQEHTAGRVKELERRLVAVHEQFQRQAAGYQAQIRMLGEQLDFVLQENQQLKYVSRPAAPARPPPVEPNLRRTSVVVSA
jgi:hypothetical protein